MKWKLEAGSQIALYAEDAVGNTSGVIKTRLNPPLSLRAGTATTFDLEWPTSEGYRLETSSEPGGPWAEVTVRPSQSGGSTSTTVTPGVGKAFYRLVAHPVSK